MSNKSNDFNSGTVPALDINCNIDDLRRRISTRPAPLRGKQP